MRSTCRGSEPEPFFISIAACQWQIVVTTQGGLTQVTVRGPETSDGHRDARRCRVPRNAFR